MNAAMLAGGEVPFCSQLRAVVKKGSLRVDFRFCEYVDSTCLD